MGSWEKVSEKWFYETIPGLAVFQLGLNSLELNITFAEENYGVGVLLYVWGFGKPVC